MTSFNNPGLKFPDYDPENLRVELAISCLQELVAPVLDCERLRLETALGRVLAEDLISPIDVPAHDNSAMDGYAFQGAALSAELNHTGDGQLRLQVVGSTRAGDALAATAGRWQLDQCVRITTGARMPAGLDTVVPLESVDVAGAQISMADRTTLRSGDNCRRRGEDLRQGGVALAGGSRIGPAALGLLASLGLPEILVRRRLRVAIFSTGNEVLQPGEVPRDGAIYDSNRFSLRGLLTRLGVELIDLGVVPDEPGALEAAFANAAGLADAVISSGGVSVGEADHTKLAMKKLASGAVFWKLAMRPGRPLAVARIGAATVFGLPGNPVAAMVTFLALVRPALLRMMGCTPQALPMLRARSTQRIAKKPGRTEYQRVIVEQAADGSLQMRSTGPQGSGVLSSMVQANGLLLLPHEQGDVEVGSDVSVLMFDGLI